MRLLAPLLFLFVAISLNAQPYLPCEPHTLPAWMQQLAWDTKPVPYTLPKRTPLHTNAFTGRWSVQKTGGHRFDFWSDKQRVVIQEFDPKGMARRTYFIDLATNIMMKARVEQETKVFQVVDLHVPQVGYFREVWSDSVRVTGRTESILGATCQELLGTDGNNDTTYYWRTDKHPSLFADMQVWGPWLCREGELEFLTALCAEPAGGSLRAQWPKRRFGPEAGSIEVLSIAPGASPMPQLAGKPGPVVEDRFLWNNSSGIGTLPAWMRACVSDLKPDSLPAAYTPAPVKRNIPDNKFIGTFTAETPTMILGLPDKKTGRDTTHRLAKYSYWADARRAVLIMDDPDDEGYLFYAVDLDADVVMASHNEMSGHVIPKLYISTLEEVGLKEFGRGLELDFTPRGHTKTMLGRECELYTTSENSLSHFWFPKKDVLNPVFDMRNWMVQRMGQKMKEVMFFGVADKPMPMAVMGTHLTSYKPGKTKPPVADLRYYRVKDERLERRRRTEYEAPEIEVRDIREMIEMRGMDMVPEMIVEEPVVIEASPDVMLTDDPDGAPMRPPTPPRRAGEPATAGHGSGNGGNSGRAELNPFMEGVMARTTNQFIGTAVLRYSLTRSDGNTSTWTVRYASDSTRMAMVSREEIALPNEHTRAYLLDRKAARETMYALRADSTITSRDAELKRYFLSTLAPAHPDTVLTGTRQLLGRTCEKRLHEIPTTRRTSWVDPRTPSLFHDVVGARKYWGGIEIILLGGMVTGTAPGMPMEVDYTYHGGDHLVMKVLELKPGPVDEKAFEITKASWKR